MELQKSELLVVANGAMVLANQIRDKAVNDAIVEYRAKWYNRILSRNLSDKEIKAKILSVDEENKRISLSIKDME